MTKNDCFRGTFFNGGILGKESLALVRNSNTTQCAPGTGIQSDFHSAVDNNQKTETSTALYASRPIGSFIDKMNAFHNDKRFGFTISLWIRPHREQMDQYKDQYDLVSPRTIFTIGSDSFETNALRSGLTLCENSKIDLQLSIIDTDLMEVLYRTSNHLLEPCQRVEFNTSTLRDNNDGIFSPTHITISLANFHQQVFVNGKSMARRREVFDNDLKHWNATSLFHFFNYPKHDSWQSRAWDGQLFQFSVYSGVLNKNQVRSIISQGLPPSQPVAHSSVARIYEDSADENTLIEEIKMSYSFIDDEIDKLLNRLSLSHQPAAYVRLYITRFPARGNIFDVGNGQSIEPNGSRPVLVGDMGRIVYVPKKDEHSEFPGHSYSSFDFCVTTNKIITSSQCVSATISVIVDPINDPPMATLPPTYFVHEGVNEEAQALLLTGFDVDKNDYIQAIQITSPPKMGDLFLSVSSFRKEDNLLHGTLLSNINNTIPGKQAYVEYRFITYDDVLIQDLSTVDFFRFRVQDRAGSWSEEAEVKVQILSSVSYSSTNDPDPSKTSTTQVEGVNYQMKGLDSSGINRTLGFFLKSLPSNGVLLDHEGAQLTENLILEPTRNLFDGNEKIGEIINITYNCVPSVCDKSNDLLVNDTFEYQVVALGTDGDVISASSTKDEHISIVCPVEQISIDAIGWKERARVSAFGSQVDDHCSGYKFDFNEQSKSSCRNIALVFGLHVENLEPLPEPIYMSITTRGGFLSLKEHDLQELRPIFHQPVMRSSIRIILPPENLNKVLSAIHFQSDTIGMDEIQFVLQYGRCDHKEKFLIEHDFSESTIECFKAKKTLYVDVQQNFQNLNMLHYPFPWIPLLVILILGPTFYIKRKVKQTVRVTFNEWQVETCCNAGADSSLDSKTKQNCNPQRGSNNNDLETGKTISRIPFSEQFTSDSNAP